MLGNLRKKFRAKSSRRTARLKPLLAGFFLLANTIFTPLQSTFAVVPNEEVLDYFDRNHVYYYNPSGSQSDCNSFATKLSGDNVKEKIWNFYIDKGFTDAQVAGIMGNGMAESGLSPTRSTTGSYWGLFQWGPRRPDLWQLITDAGLGQYLDQKYWGVGDDQQIPEADYDKILQIELEYSLDPADDSWVEAIKESNNPELSAEIFLTRFERAVNGNDPILYYAPFKGLLYQSTGVRRNFAKEFYEEYSGRGNNVTAVSGSETGKNVTIIGDSITVGATAELKEQFKDITDAQINAKVSRTWGEALEVAKNMTLNQVVVFALGTNNPAPALNQQDIDNLLQITGNRTVVLVTNRGVADYTTNNNLFKETVKSHPNVILADWVSAVGDNADKYLNSDQVHPSPAGQKLFAETIFDAVNGNINANGCSVNGEFENLVKSYAWPTWHDAPFTDRMPGYAEAVTRSQSEGRYVGGSINGVPGIDCGGFVTILVQNSGLAPDYNSGRGGTDTQEIWVKQNNWVLLNSDPNTAVDTSILQAGDVAFSEGHTFIYVGEIPGFDSNIASASYGAPTARAPMAGKESLTFGNGVTVRWYRNPKYNSNH